ncbi:AEC family transporter [Martelella alba]|uniref:AEC family transporter n=1 Tax=Martelella alba TaxID=2590451 RepID=A0ABY2SHJ9_9HYPH|nr:AEC family transporter [Martelella alba]TKI04097.1 AEC family transporter [Martelella alba]
MTAYEIMPRVAYLIAVSMLGWYASKKFKVNSQDISKLLIYIFSPIVCFVLILNSPADVSYAMYSVIFYVVSCVAAFLAFFVGRLLWKDNRANLFGAAGGQGNVGYFVLPLAIGLLGGTPDGAAAISIVVFAKVASSIYEFTAAYYITARGRYSIAHSLVLVAKMPTLHAAILALVLKYFHFELPEIIKGSVGGFVGGYSTLGMMIIGMSLARFDKLVPDWKFIFSSIIWKQGLYALVIIALFRLFHLNHYEYIVLVLLASNPLAANIAAVASALDVHPEKAACAIMISTILAVVTVPLTIWLAM